MDGGGPEAETGDPEAETSALHPAQPRGPAHVVVVMGVSAAGKTVVGRRLARRLGVEFADADAYHPPANVAKMASGTPLTDDDRWPWLAALRALIETRAAEGRSLVLACSALKRRYREVLCGKRTPGAAAVATPSAPQPRLTFVYLRADRDTLLARLRGRRGHYMKADLLASQLEALEPPRDAVTVDATLGVPGAVRQALAGLARRGIVAPTRSRRGRSGGNA